MFIVFLFSAPFSRSNAQSSLLLDSTTLEINVIADSLTIPWDLVWGPDGWIWFTERAGNIKKVDPNTGQVILVHHIDDVYESWDNSGLHALAIHPDFPEEPYLYVNYTISEWTCLLVRLEMDLNTFAIVDTAHLLRFAGGISHNGARLIFTPDKKLLMCMGEAFQASLAQEMGSNNGKVLRMNPDGTIPDDNPIPGSYVYSSGHRNPQGLVMANDILYSTEHGTGTDDELNIILPNRNYGWPEVEGFCDTQEEKDFCQEEDVEEPIWIWTHTEAPCGIDFYGHEAIPEWRNSLLVTFLKAGDGSLGQRMRQMKMSGDGQAVENVNEYFTHTYGRLRDVLVSPDGRVYISTSNSEVNGSQVISPEDDRIIEIKNPDYEGPLFQPDESLAQLFYAYPNPADDQYRLYFFVNGLELELEMFDAGGQLVYHETGEITANEWVIERKGLPSGLYLLNITFPGGGKVVKRIVFN